MRNIFYEDKDVEVGEAFDFKFCLFKKGTLRHKGEKYATFFCVSIPILVWKEKKVTYRDPLHLTREIGWFYPMYLAKTYIETDSKQGYWKLMPVKTERVV